MLPIVSHEPITVVIRLKYKIKMSRLAKLIGSSVHFSDEFLREYLYFIFLWFVSQSLLPPTTPLRFLFLPIANSPWRGMCGSYIIISK